MSVKDQIVEKIYKTRTFGTDMLTRDEFGIAYRALCRKSNVAPKKERAELSELMGSSLDEIYRGAWEAKPVVVPIHELQDGVLQLSGKVDNGVLTITLHTVYR